MKKAERAFGLEASVVCTGGRGFARGATVAFGSASADPARRVSRRARADAGTRLARDPARPRPGSTRASNRAVFSGAISNARTVIAGRLVAASAWGMVLCLRARAVRLVLDLSAVDARACVRVVRAALVVDRLRAGSCDRRPPPRATVQKKRHKKVAFSAISRRNIARSSAIFLKFRPSSTSSSTSRSVKIAFSGNFEAAVPTPILPSRSRVRRTRIAPRDFLASVRFARVL